MKAIKDARLNIVKVDSAQKVADAAFAEFVKEANEAIDRKGSFNVAISGGHTPEGFFELLGDNTSAGSLSWDKIQIFWVDEHCVPPEASASNYGLAEHTFLEKVHIPKENVHRIFGESRDYYDAVREYDSTIRRVFNLAPGQLPEFDLITLGMGVDGHIGSLFPNSYALFDTDDLVSPVYFIDGKCNRITLTHPVICAAERIMIIVSGSEKANTLKEVFQTEPDEVKYPVHTLWPILHKVTWLIDRDAAMFL